MIGLTGHKHMFQSIIVVREEYANQAGLDDMLTPECEKRDSSHIQTIGTVVSYSKIHLLLS